MGGESLKEPTGAGFSEVLGRVGKSRPGPGAALGCSWGSKRGRKRGLPLLKGHCHGPCPGVTRCQQPAGSSLDEDSRALAAQIWAETRLCLCLECHPCHSRGGPLPGFGHR